MELVDTLDLGSSAARCGGSSPLFGTILESRPCKDFKIFFVGLFSFGDNFLFHILTVPILLHGVLVMKNQEVGGICFTAGNWPLDPDKPTLIFIHGAALNKDFWEEQAGSLADSVNTLAIDLPGHGANQNSGRKSVADYARSIMDFIDLISLHRPVLCGLSMGGAIIQHLLINYPDRFLAGILINTGARLKVLPLIFETIQKDYNDFVDMLCVVGISPQSNTEKLRTKLKSCLQCLPKTALDDLRACNNFNMSEKLDLIQVPVLILSAEDDNITPQKFGNYLEKNIRNAKLTNIRNAGHFSPLENPLDVNKAILDFVMTI